VTSEELKEDIAIELENIETVLRELSPLSVGSKRPETYSVCLEGIYGKDNELLARYNIN